MKISISSVIIIVVAAFILSACTQATPTGGTIPENEQVSASPTSYPPATQPETSGQGRMMGHGSGMHARHMAPVAQDYAGLRNPVTTDQDSLARGQELYQGQCASCHGEFGLGDGPAAAALDPPPSPVAHTSRMMGDDYLFWRISEGGFSKPFQSAMPGWKDSLDEDALWDLINYLRALSRGEFGPGSDSEAAERLEMLELAVDDSVITQQEADTFDQVHTALDEYIDELGGGFTGRMEDVRDQFLAEMVAAGELTQEQVEVFLDVHDRLLEVGLMP